MGANRRFGLVLFAVCGLIYGYGYWRGTPEHRLADRSASSLPPSRLPCRGSCSRCSALWMKIGGLLHVIVSPVLLVLFYFGAVLPIGLVLRLSGKDLLRLRRSDKTYWIERQPPGPEPKTMTEVY